MTEEVMELEAVIIKIVEIIVIELVPVYAEEGK